MFHHLSLGRSSHIYRFFCQITPEVSLLIHQRPTSLMGSILVNWRCFFFFFLDYLKFELRKLAVWREGCVYSSGEKFRKVRSWCNTRHTSVMLLCATTRLVYPGSIKAFTVVSPFSLPPQSSSGCLDSSIPTNFCLFVSFFFESF